MTPELLSLYFLSDKFNEIIYDNNIPNEVKHEILESIQFLEKKLEEKINNKASNTIYIKKKD